MRAGCGALGVERGDLGQDGGRKWDLGVGRGKKRGAGVRWVYKEGVRWGRERGLGVGWCRKRGFGAVGGIWGWGSRGQKGGALSGLGTADPPPRRSFLSRDDIGIILINQFIAELIRHAIDAHTRSLPAVLEIPSKEHPYDATKDSILRRAKGMFTAEDLR